MPQVSVIMPTLNEGANLRLLMPRIGAALAGFEYEVLVIDDGSGDDTRVVCESLRREYPLRLVIREDPRDGLSGAVLRGMDLAKGEFLVVMDADLQHPPERLGAMLEPLEKGEADLVIGSRYARGGEMAEQFGILRRMLSRAATALAYPIVGDVKDPMSGFFALRRVCYEKGKHLAPVGYKVGLEILRKCPIRMVREIPIRFGTRAYGESKLTIREQFRYLEHLSRLYDYCYPRASPIGKFVVTVICSWLVAWGAYVGMVWGGAGMWWAAGWSYLLAVGVTALFHWRYCRAERGLLVGCRPWRGFWVMGLVEWMCCAGTAWWLVERLGVGGMVEVFVISFGVATTARCALRKELRMDMRGLRRERRRGEKGESSGGEVGGDGGGICGGVRAEEAA